jgi:hypothetical protein
MTGCGSVTTT